MSLFRQSGTPHRRMPVHDEQVLQREEVICSPFLTPNDRGHEPQVITGYKFYLIRGRFNVTHKHSLLTSVKTLQDSFSLFSDRNVQLQISRISGEGGPSHGSFASITRTLPSLNNTGSSIKPWRDLTFLNPFISHEKGKSNYFLWVFSLLILIMDFSGP